MTKDFHFPKSAFIGFDNMLKQLEHISQHAKDSYPPYNLLQLDEHTYTIELAVAGFSKENLEIEIKDKVLTVEGSRERKRPDDMFVYRGISSKKFSRSFRLSEYAEVVGADLRDGILTISIEVKLPEQEKPKRINIG